MSRASPVELREYLHLLSTERRALTRERADADTAVGAAEALLAGERGIRKLQQAENQSILTDMGAETPVQVPSAPQPELH